MNLRLPSFAALRAFEAVVRLESFKEAAAELNVSPSAISHQIKRLEVEVNCKLMRRDRGGIELTPQGESYASTARRALETIAEATEDLRSDAGARLTLQCYSTFTIRWLLSRLSDYTEQTGEPPIRLVTAQRDADLASEPIDACVFIGHPTDPTISYTYLFSSRVFPVASPDYIASHPEMTALSDVAQHPVIQVYPSADDWAVWLADAGVGGIRLAGEARFDSYDHALVACTRGFGVGLAIEPFATDELNSGQLVEIFPGHRATLPRHWYLASLASRSRLHKIKAFEAWLLDQVAKDPEILRLPGLTYSS
tara:strand:- start:5207 stop:6136 length:930 start_codon:yes stop_codon:yes gene_type:complete